jgi:hypothetical protein
VRLEGVVCPGCGFVGGFVFGLAGRELLGLGVEEAESFEGAGGGRTVVEGVAIEDGGVGSDIAK